MKTVLVLEQSDLDRLRGGETLDLTPQLSLSLLGKIKRVRPTFQTHTRGQMLGEDGHAQSSTELYDAAEAERLAKRRAYSAKWRERNPGSWKKYHIQKVSLDPPKVGQPRPCKDCGRVFNNGPALGAHSRHCKMKVTK